MKKGLCVYLTQVLIFHGEASILQYLRLVGRSVRSTTIASVLQIPTTTTPTTPIIPNRREMGEVP